MSHYKLSILLSLTSSFYIVFQCALEKPFAVYIEETFICSRIIVLGSDDLLLLILALIMYTCDGVGIVSYFHKRGLSTFLVTNLIW